MDRQPKPIALTFLVFCIGLKLDLIIPNHSHLRRSFMIILNKDNIFFSLFVKTPNQECVKQVHMLLNEEKWPFPLDKTNSSKGPAENRVPLLGWWVVALNGTDNRPLLLHSVLQTTLLKMCFSVLVPKNKQTFTFTRFGTVSWSCVASIWKKMCNWLKQKLDS